MAFVRAGALSFNADPQEIAMPSPHPVSRRSTLRAALLALMITLVQGALPPIAMVLPNTSPEAITEFMFTTYLVSAYPAKVFAPTGIQLTGDFFGWPTPTAFLIGLAMWFLAYLLLILAIIRYQRRKRVAKNSGTQ